MADDVQMTDAPDRQRYELRIGGELAGLADYHDQGEVRVLPHVETDAAHRGQGLAGRLVAFALDDIRARGMQVVPACPFAASFVSAHPEYGDLVSR